MAVRPLYPHELIDLAARLAGEDGGPGHPPAADLRRAVSTAYYGLFHGWTWAATAALFGGDPDDPRIAVATRWIAHSDLLELARAVLLAEGQGRVSRNKANAAKHLETLFTRPVGDALAGVCFAFVTLQEQRHDADYNRDHDINQNIALTAVERSRASLDTLWRLYAENDPETVLLLRLSFGATRIAKTY